MPAAHAPFLRLGPILAVVAVLAGIFVFTAYANRAGNVVPGGVVGANGARGGGTGGGNDGGALLGGGNGGPGSASAGGEPGSGAVAGGGRGGTETGSDAGGATADRAGGAAGGEASATGAGPRTIEVGGCVQITSVGGWLVPVPAACGQPGAARVVAATSPATPCPAPSKGYEVPGERVRVCVVE